MILCIDTRAIKNDPARVQKDIDLEDLLNNHTKYYEREEEALKDQYVPLDFSVTIRSMYSNLVLQIDKGEQKRYYTNLANVQEFPHKGADLIMYLTSIGVMHSVDYALGFDELMLKHSQFIPMGLCSVDYSLVNPIVYSHVIMSDEGAEELKKYLKSDRELVPISSVKSEGNLAPMIASLIEVKPKEEEADEPECDNNTGAL